MSTEKSSEKPPTSKAAAREGAAARDDGGVREGSVARDGSGGSNGDGQPIVNRFTRYYYEYKNALCRAQIDAASKQEQVNGQFTEAWHQEQRTVFKPAQDAYFDYLRVFHRAQINPMETSIAEVHHAQNNYIDIYQQAQDAARKAAEERRKKYAADCEAIQRESSAAQQAAFKDYVRAIKDSWTEIDPSSFDARALGATAQSLFTVASYHLSGGQVACMP